MGYAAWRFRMTGQNCAVTSREREATRTVAAKFVIEIGKHLRHHRNHNDASELPSACAGRRRLTPKNGTFLTRGCNI